MMKSSISLFLLLLSGCIIGTWPTPEGQSDDRTSPPTEQATAEELCDGVDNDADGVVDEGCACNLGDERGCIGVLDGQCGFGVQHCRFGLWAECTSLGPPHSAARSPVVTILDVSPASLVRGGTETVTVTALAEAVCPGIQVAAVDVSLFSSEPVVVRVRAAAHDDGVAPDGRAGDGEHTATLVNAFGPGVPAQSLTLRVTATIQGSDVVDEASVTLEEVP